MFKQFIFGIKVFFKKITVKNYIKIVRFLWRRYILNKNIPFSVVFALTYKCQCNCVHCFVGNYSRDEQDLSTEEVKKLLDFIDLWGPFKVTFFGGEPLLRHDIVQLVCYASVKGIRVAVDTNGILLNEDMVVALKEAGIANINVSLDSDKEIAHDLLRNFNGCFKAVMEGLSLCVKHRVSCIISTYASKRAIQEKDLERIIVLGRQLGVGGVKILLPILSGNWLSCKAEMLTLEEEKYVKSILDPSFSYIEDALMSVKRNKKGCSSIRRNLVYISPYGDVQPCPAVPLSFGNVRSQGIEEIILKWDKQPFYEKYRDCGNCLMNESNFRDKLFSSKKDKIFPINVEEIKL